VVGVVEVEPLRADQRGSAQQHGVAELARQGRSPVEDLLRLDGIARADQRPAELDRERAAAVEVERDLVLERRQRTLVQLCGPSVRSQRGGRDRRRLGVPGGRDRVEERCRREGVVG
jgi:hypothetical protein